MASSLLPQQVNDSANAYGRHAQHFLSVLAALQASLRQGGAGALETLGRFRAEWPQIELGQDRAARVLSRTRDRGDICVEYALAICSGDLPNHGISLTIPARWLQQALETPAGIQTTHRRQLLFELGQRLNRMHAYSDAKKHLDECLQHGQNGGEPLHEAILCELANAYAGLGEHARGTALLEDALEIARKEGRHNGFVLVSVALIRNLLSTEDPTRAFVLFESARAICRARSDVTGEGLLLGAIALTLQQAPGLKEIVSRRRIERFIQEYTDRLRSSPRDSPETVKDTASVTDRTRRPDPFQLQIAVSMMQSIGLMEGALDLINDALARVDKNQDPHVELEVLLQAGEIFKSAGQYSPARRIYERALRLAESLHHKSHQARILAEMAALQEGRREYTTAIAYRSSAIASQRDVGTAGDEFENLMAQGLDSSDAGDYERAREFYGKAAFVARQRRSLNAELDALTILGTMHCRFKQYDQARVHLERALECIDELRVSPNGTVKPGAEHHLLQMLGTTFFGQREYQTAILFLQRSQKTTHAGGMSPKAVKNAGVYLLLAEAFWFTRRRGKTIAAVGGIILWCGIALLMALFRPLVRILGAYRDHRLFWCWHHADIPGKPAGELFERPAGWLFVVGLAVLIPLVWGILGSPPHLAWAYAFLAACFIGLGIVLRTAPSRVPKFTGPVIFAFLVSDLGYISYTLGERRSFWIFLVAMVALIVRWKILVRRARR